MKNKLLLLLFCLVSLSSSAQIFQKFTRHQHKGAYLQEWQAIDSLYARAAVKEALDRSEKLQVRAVEEGKHGQIVKAIIHQCQFIALEEANGLYLAFEHLARKTESAPTNCQPFLKSLQAEMLLELRVNNRGEIDKRVKDKTFDPKNILTWKEADFKRISAELSRQSVQFETAKTARLQTFETVLTDYDASRHSPLLYDFLMQRQLEFYKGNDTWYDRLEYDFDSNVSDRYLLEPKLLGTIQDFLSVTTTLENEAWSYKRRFLSYQEWLSFLEDGQNPVEFPAALIDVNLKRIKLAKDLVIYKDDAAAYIMALQEMVDRFPDNARTAKVYYLLANSGAFDLKETVRLCEKTIEKWPDSYGAEQCRKLVFKIYKKDIEAQLEETYPSAQAILARLRFKNTEKGYFRLIKLTPKLQTKLERNNYNRIPILAEQKKYEAWNIDLPNENDFQTHSTEIKIPAQTQGTYGLLSATDPDFEQVVHFHSFKVTDLSLQWGENEDTAKVVLVDRTSGKAQEGVHVKVYDKDKKGKKIKLSTNQAGEIAFIRQKKTAYRLKIKEKGKAPLYYDWKNSYYGNFDSPIDSGIVKIFTDRAIYRPGQAIYFKGLVIDNQKKPVPRPEFSSVIYLLNANQDQVDSMAFVSNDFGTFDGTFQTKKSWRAGKYMIRVKGKSERETIRLEDYKRPKFEANFIPQKINFKEGETATIKGEVMAYAGYPLVGAKVRYSVFRTAQSYFYLPGGNVYISKGNTTVDEKGKFEISLPMSIDSLLSAMTDCWYQYEVQAFVTDLTGETKELTISLSTYKKKAPFIEVAVDEVLVVGKDKRLEVKVLNENYTGVFAKGNYTLSRLQPTKVDLRPWSAPKKKLIPRIDFEKDFPFFSYEKEAPQVDQIVMQNSFEADKFSLPIDDKNWSSGHYLLEIEAYVKGDTILKKQYFTLVNPTEKKLPPTLPFWHHAEQTTIEVGEDYTFSFGSAHEEAWFLFELYKENEILAKEWIKAEGIVHKTIKIKEKHRGNIAYQLTMVKNNRQYSKRQEISVPFSNKKIRFEYLSFRDKLEPGQQEEWRIKLIGPNGDKLMAEMLASMYDASLDEFTGKHRWSPPSFSRNSNSKVRFDFDEFNDNSYDRSIDLQRYRSDYESNDAAPNFFWFGYIFEEFELFMRKKELADRRQFLANYIKGQVYPSVSYLSDEDGDGVPDFLTIEGAVDSIVTYYAWDFDAKKREVPADFSQVKVRTNLQETAFFFPKLRTDKEGNITINFKMTEALTRWNFMGFAHTKDYKYGLTNKEIITQKKLMIAPNPPRFLREGDEILFTAKVTNLTENQLIGDVKLELLDAITRKPLDKQLQNTQAVQAFTTDAKGSISLSWKLKVPRGLSAVTYRVIAKAGDYGDGEENTIPVLSNRELVVETLPLSVRGGQTKKFDFKSMKKASTSTTLSNHKLTLDFTENPAWYAIQSLPYLMEYPHECTEQLFARYYANSLAATIANSHPRVKAVFEQWKNTEIPLNKLSKNEELKSALLEETPWVLEARNEEERLQRLGLLFDLNTMAEQQALALNKIANRQDRSGGFAWFPGGRSSEFISRHIVEGFGHLAKLGVLEIKEGMKGRKNKVGKMLIAAIEYLDNMLVAEHKKELQINKEKADKPNENIEIQVESGIAHYLYARSFFMEETIDKPTAAAIDYYLAKAEAGVAWRKSSYYTQGLLALAMHRMGNTKTAQNIVENLRQKATIDEEMGMYWQQKYGHHWYELPIETHTIMLEVFADIAEDDKAVENLKIWLIKNKQANDWKTTKATTAATYALLLSGDNWLLQDKPVEITVGQEKIDTNIEKEAGTGNFQKQWEAVEIKPEMAKIQLKNDNKQIAWGAMYWQYFEQMDKIESFEGTPLKLKKEVFKEEYGSAKTLTPVSPNTILAPGDQLMIRITLEAEQAMEYLHLKDLRGSGLEPIEVFSKYKWENGLGFFTSTRDLATHFFIDRLPVGEHVFEYRLRVNLKGEYSNGIAKVQSMYAPDFTAFSEDLKLRVE